MCKEFNLELLGQIPLEPKVLLTSEKGKSVVLEHPDTKAA